MYTGIIFHGRLENNILFERIKDMDLLINPRLIDSKIKYFTFPSKIVEYILSGRPVLTTRFATLPGEYKKFVYFIDELTPMGIKTSIENVFNCSEEKIFNNCQRGLEFVRNHQDYRSIVKKMYQFIWGIKGYK